ncbi:MAG: type IV pilin biogenesis protein, partial [Myxococcales bacterium]|nr:type IV pilin biogenesis protein [Myxococcales bacterium]
MLTCGPGDDLVAIPCQSDDDCSPQVCVEGVCQPEDTQCSSVEPRVLVLLDNSGSMAMQMDVGDVDDIPYEIKCAWEDCESDDAPPGLRSRIYTARRVLNAATEDYPELDFGLVSFGTAPPPTSPSELPPRCVSVDDPSSEYRFVWIESSDQPQSNIWKPVINDFGEAGIWTLCGRHRPFPYLRHDDMFGAAPGLDNGHYAGEALPPGPLYKTHHATSDEFEDPSNRVRKVQWLPRFMGLATSFDCDDPSQRDIAERSQGDYELADLCGHDFYYWPYVD